jgi:hypothetical protein
MEELYKVGKSKGLSDAQINKALKMINSGKFDTNKLTNELIDFNTSDSLKDKLHAKINKSKSNRLSKFASNYKNTTKEDTNSDNQQNQQNNSHNQQNNSHNKQDKAKLEKIKQRNKMKKLKKQYGIISDELYSNSLKEIKDLTEIKETKNIDSNHKNKLQNIINLYLAQNKNTTLEYDSDISDLSED